MAHGVGLLHLPFFSQEAMGEEERGQDDHSQTRALDWGTVTGSGAMNCGGSGRGGEITVGKRSGPGEDQGKLADEAC